MFLIDLEQTERIVAGALRLTGLALRRLRGSLRRQIETALAAASAQRKRQQRCSNERDLSGLSDQMHANRPQIVTAPYPYKARLAMARP